MLACEMGAMLGPMSLAGVLTFGAVAGFAVWTVRRFTTPRSQAMAALEDRFAKGEINEDEFRKHRSTLQEAT